MVVRRKPQTNVTNSTPAVIDKNVALLNALLGVDMLNNSFTGNAYFTKMQRWYQFYFWADRGYPHTVDNISDYITRYPREPHEIFNCRKERIFPVNFTRAITSKTLTAIFSENIDRDQVKDSPEDEFIKDCDLQGTHLNVFMKRAGRKEYNSGFSAILFDAAKPTSNISDDRARYPKLCLFDAINIIDWSYDAYGVLEYIVLRESADATYYGGSRLNNLSNSQFLVVTRTQIYRVTQKRSAVSNISSTPNQFEVNTEVYNHPLSEEGIVPVILVAPEDEKVPFIAVSGVADISKIDQAIIRYTSLRDDVLHGQTFGQLVIQADEDADIKEIVMGISYVLRYPTGVNQPEFIEPSTGAIDNLNATIESAVSQLERITEQRFTSSDSSAASGVAKAFENEGQEFSVLSISKSLQNAENLIFKFFALVRKSIDNKTVAATISKYPDSFDLRGAREFIDDFTALNTVVVLPARAQKLGVQVALFKLFKTLEPADRKTIMDQLEKMETETMALNVTLGSTGFQPPSAMPNITDQIAGHQQNQNKNISDVPHKPQSEDKRNRGKAKGKKPKN